MATRLVASSRWSARTMIWAPAGHSRQLRTVTTSINPASNRLRNFVYGTGAVFVAGIGYLYFTDTRASVHKYLVPRIIRTVFADAEDAHHFGTAALKELHTLGLHPRERGSDLLDQKLAVEVFGQTLLNPLGISGGLDKGAEIPDALFATGPSVVEIGGITPRPQSGNTKPRVFRLASQDAIINRYGLNSDGADVVAMRLRQRLREFAYQQGYGIDEQAEEFVLNGGAGVPPGSLTAGRLLAVQIAKNKLTPDNDLAAVVADHVYCVQKLAKYADIITVNVSSPNTPGLRSLQSKGPLTQILSAVVKTAQETDRQVKPVVMVKVSPDEDSESQVRGICDAIWESGVSGVIVGNTTMKRPDPLPTGYILSDKEAQVVLETGGYSGPQLFQRTKELIRKYRKVLDDGPTEGTPQTSNPPYTISPEAARLSSDGKDGNAKVIQQIEASKARDLPNLKPTNDAATTGQGTRGREIGTGIELPQSSGENQPLIRLPERHSADSTISEKLAKANAPQAITSQSAADPSTSMTSNSSFSLGSGKSKALSSPQKVIFASGGITNGEQALEALNAGASIAMCYTAVVYGGVGTISQMKLEMNDRLAAGKKA